MSQNLGSLVTQCHISSTPSPPSTCDVIYGWPLMSNLFIIYWECGIRPPSFRNTFKTHCIFCVNWTAIKDRVMADGQFVSPEECHFHSLKCTIVSPRYGIVLYANVCPGAFPHAIISYQQNFLEIIQSKFSRFM